MDQKIMDAVISSGNEVLPGQYIGISNDAYHHGPGVSKSHLDVVSKTRLHYYARYLDPNRVPPEKTEALIQGSLVDAMVFEPDSWRDNFVTKPEDINRSTKTGKAEYADWVESVGRRTIVTEKQIEIATGIDNAIRRHPIISGLLLRGQSQSVFYAIDPVTGLLVKCKPDNLVDDLAVDLKTTTSASRAGFTRSVRTYRYCVQAGFYTDVMELATGFRPKHFCFVAAEKEPPYALGLYYATDFHFARGREAARRDLDAIHQGFVTGEWPDYADRAYPLDDF